MDLLVNAAGIAAFAALTWGCLRLARRLGPTRSGPHADVHDAEKTAGYSALEQTRRLGGGSR